MRRSVSSGPNSSRYSTGPNAGISQIFTAVTDLSQLMDETVKGLRETDQSVVILKDVTQRVASVVNSFRV